MNRLGCFGLLGGSIIGFLVMLLFVLITHPTPPPNADAPPTIPPDVNIYISEYSLSRIASEAINQPAVIDFDNSGQMQVITRIPVGSFEPTMQVSIQLEMAGTDVVSRLRWVKMSFLTIPAAWLPDSVLKPAALVGETIKAQTPPDFTLVGLNTTSNGINFQLKWIGR